MKALQMSFKSESLKAIKSPVKDMAKLCGGVGNKKLDIYQIHKLVAQRKQDAANRRMIAEQRALAKKVSAQ